MSRTASRLVLTTDDHNYLNSLVHKGTTQHRVYVRAKTLLLKEEGFSFKDIADKLEITIPTVQFTIHKYRTQGVVEALNEEPGRGRKQEIFEDSIAWILNIACKKPGDLGLTAEVWSSASLTRYIRKHAVEAGFPRLTSVGVTSIRRILEQAQINPSKITYYCEKRDPDFEKRMHEVLVSYKQIELRFDDDGNYIPFEEDEQAVHTLSYDEKPGMQAVDCIAPDLPPVPNSGKTSSVMRDHEYVRHGTLSLLAAIDLLNGEAIPLVSETHKSSDFIQFLKILDKKYPAGDKIRLILDNLSAHTSRETQLYLNTVPDRFEFVFTPTHGSWLNLIESFFSKMTRQMLKGIRVKSKEELKDRIYKYFEEVNATPVPYRWKYKMDTINPLKEDMSKIVYEVVNPKVVSPENKHKRAVPIQRRSKRKVVTKQTTLF